MTQRYYSIERPVTAEERAPSRAEERTKGKETAVGLSTAHIPPQKVGYDYEKAKLKVWPGGSLVSVSHEKYSIPQVGGGIRGSVTLFSRQSKKRLLNTLATIDRKEKPLFVTATYPSEFPITAEVWKQDLENVYKRMARKFPGVSFIWKLEPQKRGAPHFHLLVWGVSLSKMRGFFFRAWYEVVGSGDEKHLHAGTEVDEVKTWRGVMAYAAKYMGKMFDKPELKQLGWEEPGRFWGMKGRKHLPLVEVREIEGLSDNQVYEMFRLMRKHAKIKARSYQSLSVLSENPEIWERALKAIKEKD